MNPFDDKRFSDKPRDGVYCVGNGMTAAYIKNGEIVQLFGPCYSAPSVFSMLPTEKDLAFRSYRRDGAVIWRTDISDAGGQAVGSIVDYCAAGRPVFIRRLRLSRPMEFRYELPLSGMMNAFSDVGWDTLSERQSVLIDIPVGSRVFGENYTDTELYARILFPKGVEVSGEHIIVPAGDSELIFAAGEDVSPVRPSFISCMEESDLAAAADTDKIYDDCVGYWEERFSSIRPLPDMVREAAHDTAAALLSQISVQGGALAGSFYHLAYGRDMYGVIRGLIALGLYDQAKSCIDFFVRQFREKGSVPNAGGMGMRCSHCHENDDCEQTGYYLLELTDLYSACGDAGFIREREDYIRYLLEAQENRLYNGMLPFNGDETYIAGGLIPRDCIDHGSMEATALYITGAGRILDAAEKLGILGGDYISARRAAVREAERMFSSNFMSDDGSKLYANAPSRLYGAVMDRYRHGVCLGCGRMRYLALTPDMTYLCGECRTTKKIPAGSIRYSLSCASLMLGFIGSEAVAADMIVNAALDGYAARCSDGNAVGYESGLWLYALTRYGCSDKALLESIFGEVMRLRESRGGAGVWVEYYISGEASPSCCPYRPWESAINMCALIAYAEAREKEGRGNLIKIP